MFDITDWNVRIIQNGEIVQDTLYNIYDNLSICFEENEGFFQHRDYKEALEYVGNEYKSPLMPSRTHHIKEHDYFSVSVGLETYIKMLKGEKEFPNNLAFFNRARKEDHSILSECLVTNLPEEVKEFVENIYKEL